MSRDLNSLLVVMPLGELGYSRYWQFLTLNPDFGYMIYTKRLITQSGAYPHASMNDLLKRALDPKETPQTWKRLLVMEHDHTFPLEVFRKHAKYTQPIVAGTYVLRDIELPLPVFYNWDASRHNALQPDAAKVNDMMFVNPGLHEVDVVPMGCTSIRRDVLENWPKDQPFFSSFTNRVLATISHDVFFCRVAQDAGWPIHIDTSLQVSHYTLVEVDVPYFRRWWNSAGAKAAIARLAVGTDGKPMVPEETAA